MNMPRPPDWRTRAWAWLRHLAVAPMTGGAKRAFVTLLLVAFALFGAELEFTAREVNAVRAAAASVVQLCRAGNEFRGQQVVLWTHLVAISRPPPHESPAQARQRRTETRAFLGYIHRVFAPRNCSAPLTTRHP